MIRISSLHVHPIKSCAAVPVERMVIGKRGPEGDRRFMIVDAAGRFVTQRTEPRLALVQVEVGPGKLSLAAPGMSRCVVDVLEDGACSGERVRVEVWRYRGDALGVGGAADAWLSDYLGRAARLVRCAPDMDRPANPEWAAPDTQVAFSDAYPILLISEASLDALNERIGGAEPLPMARFRPNVVVSGCAPFAEDDWRTLRIGDALLDVVKPCDRCAVTTVDPATAARGKEPLATLATFRRSPSGVLFGQNCTARAPATLAVGAAVEVLEGGALDRVPEAWRVSR